MDIVLGLKSQESLFDFQVILLYFYAIPEDKLWTLFHFIYIHEYIIMLNLLFLLRILILTINSTHATSFAEAGRLFYPVQVWFSHIRIKCSFPLWRYFVKLQWYKFMVLDNPFM